MLNRFALLQLIKQIECSQRNSNQCPDTLDKAYTLKRLLPVLQSIYTKMTTINPLIIAFDGRCGSGKTTLANDLGKLFDVKVIHMDDFYVPMALKTSERLNQPGGNVHYERFNEEILGRIRHPISFTYRVFNCEKQCYCEIKRIDNAPIRIVEGSYSMHPSFGDYADLYIFCDVDPEEQKRRILERNGPEKLKAFINQWIPLEESYFEAYQIQNKADFILQ